MTGGAKRVGLAIGKRLARAGFDVLFTYRTPSPEVDDGKAELASMGTRVDALQADLERDDAARSIADWVKQSTPRLDLLVNNASFYEPDNPQQFMAQSRRFMRVNCESPVELTHQLGHLLTRSKGRVVNMIDLLAEKPMPSYSAYCASKAAFANATLSLARQLAPDVTVNGISPGVIDWPDDMPLDEREAYLVRVPLRRAGTPEDAANLVHFLATDGAYITGQILRLDGGRSIA